MSDLTLCRAVVPHCDHWGALKRDFTSSHVNNQFHQHQSKHEPQLLEQLFIDTVTNTDITVIICNNHTKNDIRI